jgi:hypothetical protein
VRDRSLSSRCRCALELFAVSRWLASRRLVQLECLSEDAGRRGVGQLPARAPRRIAESDVGTERARSLGTFNILSLLASARERGLPHVYLGYHVAGCRSMEYKRKFRPNEVLRPNGTWEAFEVGSSSVLSR